VVVDDDPVKLEQALDDLDVTDEGDVPQLARPVAEEGGDHRLGDEVLGPADPDSAVERGAAGDVDEIGHVSMVAYRWGPSGQMRRARCVDFVGGRGEIPGSGGGLARTGG